MSNGGMSSAMNTVRSSAQIGHGKSYDYSKSISELQEELAERSKKMGLTPEVKDLTQALDSLHKEMELKNAQLEALEILAMESDDENVVALREQLFTTVKLVHSDVLDNIMAKMERVITNNLRERESFDSNVIENVRENLYDKVVRWANKRSSAKRRRDLIRKEARMHQRDTYYGDAQAKSAI